VNDAVVMAVHDGGQFVDKKECERPFRINLYSDSSRRQTAAPVVIPGTVTVCFVLKHMESSLPLHTHTHTGMPIYDTS
jgi:hypothetical protein